MRERIDLRRSDKGKRKREKKEREREGEKNRKKSKANSDACTARSLAGSSVYTIRTFHWLAALGFRPKRQ